MKLTDDTLDIAARAVAARLNRLLLNKHLVTSNPVDRRRAEIELTRAQAEARAERDRLVGDQ